MKAEKLAEEAANADNAAWGGVLKDTPGAVSYTHLTLPTKA